MGNTCTQVLSFTSDKIGGPPSQPKPQYPNESTPTGRSQAHQQLHNQSLNPHYTYEASVT